MATTSSLRGSISSSCICGAAWPTGVPVAFCSNCGRVRHSVEPLVVGGPLPGDVPEAYRKVAAQVDKDGWEKVAWAKGFTLLHWAARKNRPELVVRFIGQGGSPHQKDQVGKSPFDYANEGGCEASLALLCLHLPPGVPDVYVKAIKQLDESGWDDMTWNKGFSLLHWAAKSDQPELCARFLRQGADPKAKDDDGRSAYNYAQAASTDRSLVQILAYFLPEAHVRLLFQLKGRGWTAMKWDKGVTMLHWGAENGHVELCRYLLTTKGDAQQKDDFARTPLQLAVDQGHADVEALLREHSQAKASAGVAAAPAAASPGANKNLADMQASELLEVIKKLEAEKRAVERQAAQQLEDLALEKSKAEKAAAEKAREEAEKAAQKQLEAAVQAAEKAAEERLEASMRRKSMEGNQLLEEERRARARSAADKLEDLALESSKAQKAAVEEARAQAEKAAEERLQAALDAAKHDAEDRLEAMARQKSIEKNELLEEEKRARAKSAADKLEDLALESSKAQKAAVEEARAQAEKAAQERFAAEMEAAKREAEDRLEETVKQNSLEKKQLIEEEKRARAKSTADKLEDLALESTEARKAAVEEARAQAEQAAEERLGAALESAKRDAEEQALAMVKQKSDEKEALLEAQKKEAERTMAQHLEDLSLEKDRAMATAVQEARDQAEQAAQDKLSAALAAAEDAAALREAEALKRKSIEKNDALEAQRHAAERSAAQQLEDLALESQRAEKEAVQKAKEEAEALAQERLAATLTSIEKETTEKLEELSQKKDMEAAQLLEAEKNAAEREMAAKLEDLALEKDTAMQDAIAKTREEVEKAGQERLDAALLAAEEAARAREAEALAQAQKAAEEKHTAAVEALEQEASGKLEELARRKSLEAKQLLEAELLEAEAQAAAKLQALAKEAQQSLEERLQEAERQRTEEVDAAARRAAERLEELAQRAVADQAAAVEQAVDAAVKDAQCEAAERLEHAEQHASEERAAAERVFEAKVQEAVHKAAALRFKSAAQLLIADKKREEVERSANVLLDDLKMQATQELEEQRQEAEEKLERAQQQAEEEREAAAAAAAEKAKAEAQQAAELAVEDVRKQAAADREAAEQAYAARLEELMRQLADEKDAAEKSAAERARAEAEGVAAQALEAAAQHAAEEKARLEREALERLEAVTRQAEEERALAEKRLEELAAEQKHQAELENFSQRVSSQLSARSFRELNDTLHEGKQRLQDTEDGRKRFADAIALVTAELRSQHDDAKKVLRSAKLNLPSRLDAGKFDTCVVPAASVFSLLSETEQNGQKFLELVPEVEGWLTSLVSDCEELLACLENETKVAFDKWWFHKALGLREDVIVLSGIGVISEKAEELILQLKKQFTEAIGRLDQDLAAMVDFDVEAKDGPRCAVHPRRVDDLFHGLRKSNDCDDVDFGEISRHLLKWLEGRVGELYDCLKASAQHGEMTSAELLARGATELQASDIVTSSTPYTGEAHAKILHEALLSLACAKRDPAGFNRRLGDFRSSDAAIYRRSLELLKADLAAARSALEADIANLRVDAEAQLEAVIESLADMHCYAEAVANHCEEELHLRELMTAFAARMKEIQVRAEDSSDMDVLVSTCHYLKAAVEKLKETQVDDMRKIAEELEPACDELEGRMSQQAQAVCTDWEIIAKFDVCADSPPVAALLSYMGMLFNNKKALQKSLRRTRIVDPATDGNVGDGISFDSAVDAVKAKVQGLDKEALWQECSAKGTSKHDARLGTALHNLQKLAHDRPETGAAEARAELVDYVRNRLRALQTQTVDQFRSVMDQGRALAGEARSQELKAINRQLEESTRVRALLQAFPDTFPDQQVDQVVEVMKTTASKMHQEFLDKSLTATDSIADHLVAVYEVASAVSSEPVRNHVHGLIGAYLKQLLHKKVDFIELAQALCDLGPLGGQLVDDFEQFRQYKLDRIKTKTAGMTFEHALQQLAELNPSIQTAELRGLEAAWKCYTERYEALLDEHMFSGSESLHKKIKDEVADITSGQRGKQTPSMPEILAGICAAVSLEMSAEKQSQKESMMHPHPVQVLALLRLLGLETNASSASWKLDMSHLIQVSTGEGKSIVLGVLSIMLALFGYEVDCVCYSTYLSVRDYKSFSNLFNAFGVKDAICYGTFGELARRHFNQKGDVRAFAKSLLAGDALNGDANNGASPEAKRTRPKVLLVDEVDVFFSRDFYGALYCPSVVHQTAEVKELLTFIWNGRGQALTLERVQEAAVYKKLEARYFPHFKQLIDQQIRALLHATTTYTAPEHAYEVLDGRIGYVEHGSVNTSLMHGYNTTFCYFKEKERGNVSQAAFDEILGLNVCCGRFSYAEMPLVYSQMLGVTGTLSSLGEFEEGIIRNVYHIRGRTIMPSMYGRRDANFDEGVHVEKGKGNYHRKIQDEINHVVAADRSVLVFFESEERLQEFMASEYGQRLKDSASVVTTGTNSEVDHYVKQATRSREVTLFTKVFGRGLDFVCFDKTVMARGGVAVIQTFLSEDIAEEIQIKGRTCRQGEKGTYKMILLAEDIVEWNELKSGDDEPTAPAPAAPVRRQSLQSRRSRLASAAVDLAALDAEVAGGEASPSVVEVDLEAEEIDLMALDEDDDDMQTFAPAPAAGSKRLSQAKAPAHEPFLSWEALEYLQSSGSARLYEVLDKKRREWFTKESEARGRTVQKARRAHDRSVQFQCDMHTPATAGAKEKILSFLASINAGGAGGSSCYHVVFCLDESYSMSGSRWDQLNQAFRQFLRTRSEAGTTQDLVSVVQFATESRITLAHASLEQACRHTLQMQQGATFFRPPLEHARELIEKGLASNPKIPPLLVFMSDGENKDGDPGAMMQELFPTMKGLVFHAVFFGQSDEPGSDLLLGMAQAVPGGKFHHSLDDGAELVSTFEGIAAEVTAL